MGNDFIARKQRRKEAKRNGDGDGAPRRIRKKKQPKRICRGPCHRSPVLDLDSSDEDMIATVRSRRASIDRANDIENNDTETSTGTKTKTKKAEKRNRSEAGGDDEVMTESKVVGRKKLSTSAKLTLPTKAKVTRDGGVQGQSFHSIITTFMKNERIATPLPLQTRCWPEVLQGKNVYVTAQPGSGKTLSYLLPIACKLSDDGHSMATRPAGPLAVVLLPTRELAQQVAMVCKRIKRWCGVLRVSCLTGGSEKQRQFDSLKRCPHIVVATPGRLVDMLEDNALQLDHIQYVVLDEADKMLSLGFADQLDKIRAFLQKSGVSLPSLDKNQSTDEKEEDRFLDDDDDDEAAVSCQVGLYSATNPPGVLAMSRVWCGNPTLINLADSSVNDDGKKTSIKKKDSSVPSANETDGGARISENVVQVVHVCADHKKMSKLSKHLGNIETLHKDERHRPKILVFANRIKTVKTIARELRQLDKKVTEIHGDKSQEEREKAIQYFKGGKFNILVASDVAARGLHVKNLSYVVNYDFPSNLETYVHRVGRTGRVDAQGHAFSFFTRSLAPLASPMIKLLESHNQDIDPNLVKLAESYAIIQEKMKQQGSEGLMPPKKEKKKKEEEEEGPLAAGGAQAFKPSSSFRGVKSGYYFSSGSKGLGYYLDAPRFSTTKKKTAKQQKDTPKPIRMLPGKLARMKRRSMQEGPPSDLSSDEM